MRERIESQKALQFFPIDLEELSRISGARVGHDQPDIKVICGLRKILQESRLRKIRHDRAELHLKVLCNRLSDLIEQSFSSGHKHHVDARSCNLAGELAAYTRCSANYTTP